MTTENKKTAVKTRKSYSLEFKEQAVKRVVLGEKITDVANDIGVNPQILGRWKRELTNDKAGNHQDGRDKEWYEGKIEKNNRDYEDNRTRELQELRHQNQLMRELIQLTIY